MYVQSPPRATCRSGIDGYQCHLQDNYNSYEEWKAYADMYGLHHKLGFTSIRKCWDANPEIQGSVHPEDFCKIVDGQRHFFDCVTAQEIDDE
jgi:hypothetical protein